MRYHVVHIPPCEGSPGSLSPLTITTRPSANTISISTTLSTLRPYIRLMKPKPARSKIDDPTGCADLGIPR